jgi:hypothetical protein
MISVTGLKLIKDRVELNDRAFGEPINSPLLPIMHNLE